MENIFGALCIYTRKKCRKRNTNLKILLSMLFAFLISYSILMIIWSQNIEIEDSPVNNNFFLILEFTKFFSQEKFCNKKLRDKTLKTYSSSTVFTKVFNDNSESSELYTKLDQCEYKNCFFTCDKSLIKNSNAILFHDYDLTSKWNSFLISYWNIFKQRSFKQLWIYWNDEPNIVDYNLDEFKFNWTISFHSQADISRCAYGCLKTRNEKENFLLDIKNEFSKRKNSAIWLVSNCKSSFRLKIALELSNFFNIKTSGSCSKYFEKSKNYFFSFFHRGFNYFFRNNPCPRESKCEIDYLSSNKFYLAFESTNCSDYITEKFWRSLSFGLIPIVIQPSKESYERIAPVDSFIHAQDFNFDARLLAEYLQKVSNSFDLYLKHTKWRLNYDILYKSNDLENKRICDFCKKLNQEYGSSTRR